MQLREEYDLIVVGDQLSGLFLAAGAAQAGQKVLVIEGTSRSTALFEVPTGRFLTDLVCEPLIGLERDSKADLFLKSLGLYQDLEELFPAYQPSWQCVTDRMRLDFDFSDASFRAELGRETELTPHQLDKLVRILGGAYATKRPFSEAVAQSELAVSWERFGTLPLLLFGSLSPKRPSLLAYKRVQELAKGSVRYVMGGRSALKERLQSRVKVFGGAIKKNTWAEEIIFERGKLTGALLSSYEGFVRSPVVVGALGANTFLRLIPRGMQSRSLRASVDGVAPRAWRLSFTITLHEESLPEGIGYHGSFHDESGELMEDAFLQWEILPKEAYSGIPSGMRAMHVRMLMPFETASLSEARIARVLKRSLQRLEKLIPFLKENEYWVSPNPENLAQDPVFQRHYRFPGLEHIPPVHLVYESGLGEGLENFRYLDWSEFGLEGLALCSRDIHPYFGLRGEIQAAMELLSVLAAKRLKRKK